jgi:hypothetical protein
MIIIATYEVTLVGNKLYLLSLELKILRDNNNLIVN